MSEDVVEVMARGMCRAWGANPDGAAENPNGPGLVAAWTWWIPKAQAALSALTEGGWAVVPVEPTEGMIRATDGVCQWVTDMLALAQAQGAKVPDMPSIFDAPVAQWYRAMIAAIDVPPPNTIREGE
jgi:hypothetical protein